MRQGFLAAAFIAAGMLVLSPAQAASTSAPKLGVVDLEQVIGNCHRGQEADQVLKQDYAKLKASVDDKNSKRKAFKDQLDKTDSKSADYSKLLKQYQDSDNDYQQYVSESNQMIQQRRQELLQPIQQELVQVMTQFAKDNHFDILLNKNIGGAVYASDSFDSTTQLTEAMDKDWAQLQKAAATAAPAGSTH